MSAPHISLPSLPKIFTLDGNLTQLYDKNNFAQFLRHDYGDLQVFKMVTGLHLEFCEKSRLTSPEVAVEI